MTVINKPHEIMKTMHLPCFPFTLWKRIAVGLCVSAATTFVFAAPVVPQVATARVAVIQVRVAPDRPGWTYAVGEPAKFHIEATADGESLEGELVHYSVGPEELPAEDRTATLTRSGLTIDAGTMTEPGFLRCIVTITHEGKTYRGLATAAFSPEAIKPTQTDPSDFDRFWAEQKAELAKIPLEAKMTLQPDLCTPSMDVFHVSFQNVGAAPWSKPSRIYGILCVPKGKGPFPAILRPPGAGIRPYSGWRDGAEQGAITLEIGIHGIPVNLPAEVYAQLGSGALSSYFLNGLDDRERYYYRRVYLGCVRANDFLTTLPQFDGRNLAVIGGSQGGQLAIVTAALDSRVLVLGSYYPAFCDVTGSLHGRAGGWPQMMKPEGVNRPSKSATPEKIATTGYYDTVNFARRLKVPGYYSWGYNDEVCPPTSTFAAYNTITAPKQLLLTLERGHETIPEQSEKLTRFVYEKLGLPDREVH